LNLHQLAGGPFVWVAFAVFFIGLVVQTVRFFKMTSKNDAATPVLPAKPKAPEKIQERLGYEWDKLVKRYRRSVFHLHPLMSVATLIFHVLLFLVPIFLLAHNELFRISLGFGLPSFPDWLSDALAIIVLSVLGIFLFRRLFIKRVRIISGVYDYLILIITAAPFITGVMAYHKVFDYNKVLTAHMLMGELMLVLIPFTRLGHALFFVLYRVLIPGEYSFRKGSRRWNTGAGKVVARSR